MERISRRSALTVLGGLGGAAALAACAREEATPSLADGPSTTLYRGRASESGSPSSTSSGSARSGDLITIDLDPPEDLRSRWAAIAAAWIGASISSGPGGPRAAGGDWVYESELGQWAYLVRRAEGRAVLVGQSNPDLSRADDAEARARAALVAGAPTWWRVYEKVVPDVATVGFIIGWDGARWQQVAGVPAAGGFSAFTFYPASSELAGDQIAVWATRGKQGYSGSTKAPVDAVLQAGPKVTSAQLTALGPGVERARVSAAVRAARAFAGRGKH